MRKPLGGVGDGGCELCVSPASSKGRLVSSGIKNLLNLLCKIAASYRHTLKDVEVSYKLQLALPLPKSKPSAVK